MISPRMFKTPIPARQAKVMFIAFLLRHGFGILVFVWLVTYLRSIGEGQWVTMLVISLAYIAFAVYNARKLWNLYRRRLASEQQGR